MYAISLSSIPPRFDRLAPVLHSLLTQRPAPAQVILCLPARYRRFPGSFDIPSLPDGVTLMAADDDLGPATKVLPAARALAGRLGALIYCDDDWLAQPGWAAALLAASRPGHAVTGAGFGVERLKRRPAPGSTGTDIAQGFSGVLIDPAWLSDPETAPPPPARMVDDIWLSGHLARQGIPVLTAAHARARANRACADLLHARYGICPPVPTTASAARR